MDIQASTLVDAIPESSIAIMHEMIKDMEELEAERDKLLRQMDAIQHIARRQIAELESEWNELQRRLDAVALIATGEANAC